MKKILTSILAAGAFTAFGQGLVQLDNLAGTGVLAGYTLPGGGAAVGANFMAAVYNSVGDVLLGQGSFDPALIGGRAGRHGAALRGTIAEVAGVAVGKTAKLYVQVWDSTKGATFAASTLKGQSAVFETLALGGNNPGDPFIPKLDGLQSFALADTSGPVTPGPTTPGPVIPEPSTIALGALGAAALVLRFRK